MKHMCKNTDKIYSENEKQEKEAQDTMNKRCYDVRSRDDYGVRGHGNNTRISWCLKMNLFDSKCARTFYASHVRLHISNVPRST
jgi:hypothetical protein